MSFYSSGTRRCLALFSCASMQANRGLAGRDWQIEPSLWEQDFGTWDGKPYAENPDLGTLTREELAWHRPPEGESFLDVVSRHKTALEQMPKAGRIAIIAHAGLIRAALSVALDHPESGLAFTIASLSVTSLRDSDGAWAITSVNLSLGETDL